jgi:hypothetical protein
MSLAWVRLDTGIASHDKILNLLADPSSKRWQAAASYMFALGWCGNHATDGHIPTTALPFVHGTKATADLLVRYGLWDTAVKGWHVRNYLTRQQAASTGDEIKAAQQAGSKKGNCIRWHGDECGCWRQAG